MFAAVLGLTRVLLGAACAVLLLLQVVLAPLFPPPPELLFMAAPRGTADLFRLDVNRALVVNITRSPDDDTHPAWSPDGQYLAYYTRQAGRIDLHRMSAIGADSHRLAETGAAGAYPVWSPDGHWIAFSSARQETAGVYRLRPDGTGLTRLTNRMTVALFWSPDGQYILFLADCDSNCDLFLMHADGSNLRRLTRNGNIDAYPVWSPDSRRVAFVSNRSLSFDLYLLEIDCDDSAFGGCPVHRLTENRQSDSFPAWSPDGRFIAFASDRTGDYEIHLLEAGCYRQPGGCAEQTTRLTTRPGTDIVPLWSPAGDSLLFLSAVGSTFDLNQLTLSTGAVRRLYARTLRDGIVIWRPTDHPNHFLTISQPS
ncbi:MAG: PD40 domain-containing protein [Anaerolineae bacterium]|nr:PD40 domain-containing protein [Anaerolineae bacterium]